MKRTLKAPRLLAVRIGALLLAAAAALLVTALPAAAATTGKFIGDIEHGEGFRMNGGQEVYASLLGIELDDEAHTVLKTYCVEIDVNGVGGADMVESPWSDYPSDGADDFAAQSEKVLWILHNSYPTVSVEDLSEASGVANLTLKEAITGTQAAIWHFSNGATMDADQGRLNGLYDYLTGPANTGLTEQPPASLTIDPGSIDDGVAGSKVGPYTVHTTATEVSLTVTGSEGVTIVDAEGAPLSTATDGTKFWLTAPDGDELGDATVKATASAQVEKGRLFVGSEVRTQTLVVATSTKTQAKAEASAKWKTHPTTSPTTTSPTTTTTETTATSDTTVPPTTTTVAPPAQGGPLPNTGASVLGALGVGLLLLGAGIGFLVLQRRRGNSGNSTA